MKKLLIIGIATVMFFKNGITTTADSQETYLSEEIQTACVDVGEEVGICPELLMAIIETESGGNPKAKNGSCKGLMQMSEKWHKGRMKKLEVSSIYDIYGNIQMGADYILELADEYEDVGLVLMIYHGESKAIYNAEHGVLSNYAKKILDRSAELERLHGK